MVVSDVVQAAYGSPYAMMQQQIDVCQNDHSPGPSHGEGREAQW
jgi:hypothetical protein